MDNDNGIIWIIIIIAIVLTMGYINGLNGKIKACDNSIQNANSQIASMNGSIQNAKEIQWNDYQTMGNAIGDLQDGNEVSNPCSKDYKFN